MGSTPTFGTTSPPCPPPPEQEEQEEQRGERLGYAPSLSSLYVSKGVESEEAKDLRRPVLRRPATTPPRLPAPGTGNKEQEEDAWPLASVPHASPLAPFGESLPAAVGARFIAPRNPGPPDARHRLL